jgi:predicted 3-demethylubiquinone-9 3-methyltransferase (glyoxalase superfamily)
MVASFCAHDAPGGPSMVGRCRDARLIAGSCVVDRFGADEFGVVDPSQMQAHDTRPARSTAMATVPKITPNLWFDDQAEEAAQFYTSVFKDSRIVEITHYGEAGPRPAGMVMTVSFELAGQQFTALNGGPDFTFNEACSFVVSCEDQAEVDYFWDKLTEGGGEPGPCGWLKDRFGLSWQIVPAILPRLVGDPDTAKAQRVMAAMLQMGKLDVQALQDAADRAS